VALAALALYRTTLLPGLGFWDTGEAQTVLPVLGTMHPTGFPALVVLGWLFSIIAKPLGEPALLMNLLAALCAALAAGGAVMVSRRLGLPLPVGVAAAAGFAVTPVVWHISTAIDAHALHVLLVVALTLALLRWQALVDGRRDHPGDDAYRRRGDRAIVLAAGVYGVAAANHALALILAPSIVLFVLVVEPRVLLRPRLILTSIGTAVGVAALLYLELPLRAGPFRAPLVYAHPETWQGFWDVVLAKQFQGDVVGLFSNLGQKTSALLQLGTAQFGPLVALVPAGLFAAAARQPKYALFSGTAVLVTVTFAASYTNADITRYYLGPVFFVWTWFGLLACTLVDVVLPGPAPAAEAPLDATARPGRRHTALPIALATVFGIAMLVPSATSLGATRQAVDQSGNNDAQVWLDEAFSAMAPGAVVISWWSYSTPMWYGEYVDGRRTDIKIIDDSNVVWDHLGSIADVIDRYLGSRPVYVMRQSVTDIENLAQQFAIQPVGRPVNLYLVTGRLGTTP
jgi:Protein O-mannosyl-transferase TMEM260-like